MDLRYSLKWALLYRGVAVGALLLGLLLVVVGFLAGFGTAVTSLVADPLNPGSAIEQSNPTITVMFAVLGLIVWQLGKTYALFLTLPRAAGRSAARKVDSERLAEAVAANLDERLAAIEADVAETRREVQELKRAEHTARFHEGEHLEGDADARSESAPDSESEPALEVAETENRDETESDDATASEPYVPASPSSSGDGASSKSEDAAASDRSDRSASGTDSSTE